MQGLLDALNNPMARLGISLMGHSQNQQFGPALANSMRDMDAFSQLKQVQQANQLRQQLIEQQLAEKKRREEEEEKRKVAMAGLLDSMASRDVESEGPPHMGMIPMESQMDPQARAQLGLLSDAAPNVLGKMLESQLLPKPPKSTDDITEYQQAVAQGYPGTFMEYMTALNTAKGTNVNNIIGGEPPYKIPSNYMLKDPKNPALGVVPIPGGPGEKRSGETAGKEAMINTSLVFLPVINDLLFQGGDPSAEINREALFQKAGTGFIPGALLPQGSQLANAYELGIQAITRIETGAAMPPEEVKNTRKRFEPGALDSDDVIRQKHMAYKLFLENSKRYLNPTGEDGDKWKIDADLALADAKKALLTEGVSTEGVDDGWVIREKR